MHQLGFHLTSNHLMQYWKAKAKSICKIQGRVVCIRGLPLLTEKSGSYDVSQVFDPTSTDGITFSTTWLTTTCSPSFTTRNNNAMLNMMQNTKHDARWWMQKLTTWTQLSFAVPLQIKLTKHSRNTNTNCQRSIPTNDPRTSLNQKFKQNLNHQRLLFAFLRIN